MHTCIGNSCHPIGIIVTITIDVSVVFYSLMSYVSFPNA